MSYFSIHASLDTVDHMAPMAKDYYLGCLKPDENPLIYCYLNPTGLRLLIAVFTKKDWDKKAEQSINNFFVEANKVLTGAVMNPLYKEK
jgi:hypothetical protein